jgi:hypothetical protein
MLFFTIPIIIIIYYLGTMEPLDKALIIRGSRGSKIQFPNAFSLTLAQKTTSTDYTQKHFRSSVELYNAMENTGAELQEIGGSGQKFTANQDMLGLFDKQE